MTPEAFQSWAAAIADKAAAHPEILERVDAEAAENRRAAARSLDAGTPMEAAAAELRARTALTAQWDASRRTFDRVGPRFPRFERLVALRSLKAPWAQELGLEAAKGALLFQDLQEGGIRRAANPDGSPAALETVASDQAAALDALCGIMPDSARKELGFLDKTSWGWRAGYATAGKRAEGPARLGEDADLARAVRSIAIGPSLAGGRSHAIRGCCSRTRSAWGALCSPRGVLRTPSRCGGGWTRDWPRDRPSWIVPRPGFCPRRWTGSPIRR
jgi:hypothetical protein